MEAGCALTPAEIVITHGATEAIYLSLQAVTKPGDTVAIESPTYYNLLEILNALHLKALALPTNPQTGVSLEALENALQQSQIMACVLVANFNNPLGSCMSEGHKRQLVSLLNNYQIPLIEDDVYGELNFQGVRPKAIKAFDTEGLVLYCSSISKTLSPGLRVGWCVPGRYQLKVEQLKMAMNLSNAPLPQLTIAAFLANGGYDRHLRQLRRAFELQVDQMSQAVCTYFPAETKMNCLVRPRLSRPCRRSVPFANVNWLEESWACKICPFTLFWLSNDYQIRLMLNMKPGITS